jgi:hypothetical protein
MIQAGVDAGRGDAMTARGSVYARGAAAGSQAPAGGWAGGARCAASRGTAAGMCRWNCPPGRAASAAGSAGAASRTRTQPGAVPGAVSSSPQAHRQCRLRNMPLGPSAGDVGACPAGRGVPTVCRGGGSDDAACISWTRPQRSSRGHAAGSAPSAASWGISALSSSLLLKLTPAVTAATPVVLMLILLSALAHDIQQAGTAEQPGSMPPGTPASSRH